MLLDEYIELWERSGERPDGPEFRCRRCGQRVVDVSISDSPRWTHVAADGGFNVGCRAASFTADAGWDDNVARSWRAAPG